MYGTRHIPGNMVRSRTFSTFTQETRPLGIQSRAIPSRKNSCIISNEGEARFFRNTIRLLFFFLSFFLALSHNFFSLTLSIESVSYFSVIFFNISSFTDFRYRLSIFWKKLIIFLCVENLLIIFNLKNQTANNFSNRFAKTNL
jgi:hypothetical protein